MRGLTDSEPLPCTIPETLARFENSEMTALICGREELSYRELLADARHIAHALAQRGVKKGDRVVVDIGRSADYIRMYLGIIFAGAVQVTLHKSWPESQRTLALSDCTPALIVDKKMARGLLHADLLPAAAKRPLPSVACGDPCLIYYTSGSTGVPKGVVNSHMLVVSGFTILTDEKETEPTLRHYMKYGSRFLLDANLAFSITPTQIFLALCNGKALVMATEEELETAAGLAACIRRTGADVLYGFVSLYYKYLSDPGFTAALSGVKTIFFSGERSNVNMLAAFRKITDAQLCFAYGSAEALLVLTGRQIPGEEDESFPAAYSRYPVYVLEEGGTEVVSPGSKGELCIGGPAGQYGTYWNAPGQTSDHYINHPLYGRLFRSGDLVQMGPGGRIRILGRLYGMAKLHGMRIEPGAIENAMEAFPGVRRAAVKIQGEGTDAVLCGYYSGSVDQGALRRFLSESLPYYMVPALMRELQEFPLNRNGKLDRGSLPPIQGTSRAYVPPETETEKLLCEVFAQVLEPDTPIGIDDSFFELGGNSILGMAAGALLQEQGYQLKVEWIFSTPTVRGLSPMLLPAGPDSRQAEWTLELTDSQREQIDKAVGFGNVEAVYPVMFHAKEYLARNSFWMITIVRVVDGCFSREEIRQRLDEMTLRHTALRSVFIGGGTLRPMQVILKQAELSCFHIDLRSLADGKNLLSAAQENYLRSLILLHRHKSTDWSKEVPFYVGLVRVAEERIVVFLYVSHLMLDAAGIDRIIEELLGRKTIEADAAEYERNLYRLSREGRIPAQEYWKKVMSGRTAYTSLPQGKGPKPFVHDEAFSDSGLIRKLLTVSARRKVTVSAMLHLAAGESLMELLGLQEVCFASTTSGRDASSSGLAGMFINHFPVVIRCGDTLEIVQDQIMTGMRFGYHGTEELPYELSLPGMAGKFKLNVENNSKMDESNILPYLMRGDWDFAAAESAALQPPEGIDGELTLMAYPGSQLRLDFFYSPASIDRIFVKRFCASLLRRLRLIGE